MSQRATPRTGTLLVIEIDIGLSELNGAAEKRRHLSIIAFKLR
ncbi:hypothetical protein [Bradyrhizobium diazoefficiens]|nr:hypothetical protein [Bradyrhizobium diazoefficiens]